MDKKQIKRKVMKWIGILVLMLGLAFEDGAFLVYLQGVILQIIPLAVTGAICLVGGIVFSVIGRQK